MRYCSARGGSCAFSDTDLICCKCRCNSNTRYFASYGRCVRPDLVTKVPTAQRSTVNSLNTTTATLVLTSSKASNTSFSTSTAAITTLEDLVTTAGGFTSTTMTITPAGFSTASKKNHSTWKSTTISITTRVGRVLKKIFNYFIYVHCDFSEASLKLLI